MRSILFFDLPTLTLKQQRSYRIFVKKIKKIGFYMIQESVYVKLSINQIAVDSLMSSLKSIVPTSGSIIVINITEKQFSQMQILCGEISTDVLNNDERTIIL